MNRPGVCRRLVGSDQAAWACHACLVTDGLHGSPGPVYTTSPNPMMCRERLATSAEYAGGLTWNGCAKLGEVVFGFGDALGQRPLEPKPPPCRAVLSGQAAGQIAA